MAEPNTKPLQYMNVVVRSDSRAATALAARTRSTTLAIAGGIASHHELDLTFHGGKTIHDLAYYNVFIGGQAAWASTDVTNINDALSKAMADRDLNNVLVQYFNGQAIASSFLGAHVLTGSAPHIVTKGDVEAAVAHLFTQGTLAGLMNGMDVGRTVVNILLPRNTVLFTDEAPTGGHLVPQDHVQSSAAAAAGGPADGAVREEEDSLHGLGGFHGSVRVALPGGGSGFVYYATGVFSAPLTSHRQNGIVFFPQPWKNVVATFYHELCETRTNPDVEEVNRTGNAGLLGWYADGVGEIGDIPMELAGANLGLVMKEVPLTTGGGTVPVQLQWSNAVGGPEGPIPAPH